MTDRRHPTVKLLVTLGYLIILTSFDRAAISQILPLLLFPVLLFALADMRPWPILRRVLMVMPFLIGVGLFSPLLDRQPYMIGGLIIAHGWLNLISILLKGVLTVSAVLLLISTVGMDQLAVSLRQMHVPRLFVTTLLLIYRYLTVLGAESTRIQRAYALRAPSHSGVRFHVWGSLAGHLLLRSFDRAERVHQAMLLRGFSGEFHTGAPPRLVWQDITYLVGWGAFFALARSFDLPGLLGSLMTGVMT